MSRYQLPEIQEVQAVKTAREVSHIATAQRVSEAVLKLVVRKLRVGVGEISLARFIVAEFKRRGVKALAFEPIVAFGKGTADIHHWATNARLKQGDIVMFDFGATHQGYCSDMTRTLSFGEPSAKFRRVYQTVLTAQNKALKLLSHGERRTRVIDSAARSLVHRRFGTRSLTHGLGHGIGSAIHEWPYMKPGSADLLQPGMVVTVEPGVYLKGWGGVRIEDMVLLRQHGVKNLTQAAKDFSAIIVNP